MENQQAIECSASSGGSASCAVRVIRAGRLHFFSCHLTSVSSTFLYVCMYVCMYVCVCVCCDLHNMYTLSYIQKYINSHTELSSSNGQTHSHNRHNRHIRKKHDRHEHTYIANITLHVYVIKISDTSIHA
jgi:hypothetical protein